MLLALAVGLTCGVNVALAAAFGSEGTGVNLIIDLQGQVSLKREGWGNYFPAFVGMAVSPGDLLRMEGSSRARVACSDLTIVVLSERLVGIPCGARNPVLMRRGDPIASTRAAAEEGYPMLLSPRKTLLLTDRPMLRWKAVAGASGYKVTVHGSGLRWTSDAGQRTELPYPETAPALLPGKTYKVTVVAGERSSDEEADPEIGFTRATEEQDQKVRVAEAQIRKAALPAASVRFLTAQLYAGQGLIAEAIDQLEATASEARVAAVSRLLGDLYLQAGLTRLAEQRYESAAAQSRQSGDREGAALAESALGRIYYKALGNRDAAARRFKEAARLFQQLGDRRRVAEIEQTLSELAR